jgi:hypothetical protein
MEQITPLGFGTRISSAFRCFFSLLFEGRLPGDVLARYQTAAKPAGTTTTVAPPAAGPREDSGDRAVQLLAILQRDGRLIDFLLEDLGTYSDAQIGAAVRDVHANCRAALGKYMTVEPVLSEAEGDRVRVAGAIDPTRLKVIGAVPTSAAAQGIVRHRGWRVTHIALPPLAPESGREILAPAEVEVA